MAIFGIVTLMYEFEVKVVVKYFQLLHSATSRGVFFIFVGLLGWCQAWQIGGRYADLVTLLTGGFSIVTGIVCVVSRMKGVADDAEGASPGNVGPTPVTHLI